MSKDIVISIITPTYNSSRFIADTIRSIKNQTYQNWELLITDDCSSDNTCEIIERFIAEDNRIKLFRLEKNSGAGVARNNSIEKANGRFIAFCDSDDRWFPEKLEKQIRFMLENDCALSYSSYMTCNEEGVTQGIVVAKRKETFFSMKCDSGIGCLTAMYDTDKVGKVLMPEIRKRQDWGLWLKIMSKCGVAYGLKEPLALYRLRSNSISSKKSSLIKYNLAVYTQVLGWNKVRAILFFGFFFVPSYLSKKLLQKIINR